MQLAFQNFNMLQDALELGTITNMQTVRSKFFLRSYDRASRRFLVNKTNRRTKFQFYWYYDSTCFGQTFCPSSGVLSISTGTFYADLMTVCYQEQDGTSADVG